MTPFNGDIEKLTLNNNNYRHVISTAPNMQLVLMSLKPGEEIGLEQHPNDQFIRIEQGNAKAIVENKEFMLQNNHFIIIPANTWHNIINTSKTDKLKLYTIYAPPHHPDGLVQSVKIIEKEGKKYKLKVKN